MRSDGEGKTLLRIAAAAVMFIPLAVLFHVVEMPTALALPLFIANYLIVGLDVVIRAIKGLVGRSGLDENLLMTIASIGAFIVGECPEAVAVMLFYQVGELFQRVAVGKSRKNISELMDIRPDSAVVEREGREITLLPEEVAVGELMLVRPGDRIALDGVVESGESELNTVALTGEALPRHVAPGDEVLSGSVNESGFIRVRVQKPYGESTVARILELVENASDKKAVAESFITRFSAVYTPAVVIAAVLLALIPSFITGAWSVWVYRALTFLVVSCPCALVISVPLSFFGAIGGAGKKGILIKGGACIEALAKTDIVLLDKTGTLTKGEFKVKKVVPKEREDEILRLAAIAESRSVHPIARSITELREVGASDYEITEYAGKGIRAEGENGTILVGSYAFMTENGVSAERTFDIGTVVYVAHNGEYVGAIVIGDEIKTDSAAAIAELKAAGVKPVMLTGDSEGAARSVAAAVGIDEVHFSLLPAGKLEETEKRLGRKKTTAFAGDGINDAPSLMRADVGIAMGGVGSDCAIESADVVLMHDRLSDIAKAIRLSKKTMRIVRQNIAFTLSVKLCVLVLSALGIANMWLSVFADVGVAVLAVLNAMRMLRVK